ncbi:MULTISPECIES: response regulator transcription factor [unclassified Solwaraspora]|uniref:response regulator transcription factor n=1 Tax=unclassified Solwaraspora TaxID=2627926 RepID=UPI00249BD256|nr:MULTISPECIES: response regulator transcription factor [unclassified Solwaraspora]WFE22262.1 response regulator transcription factor [Solwaraspora sp. WMMD937]WJK33882.1 response regulator transcription factor [Solwaraspora sp. WMMA2065]
MVAHVLIAEDDRRQAEVLRRYVESDGHRTTVVHDGRDALDQARRHRPQLLVLDVMMPGLDGLNVCRILRRESDLLVLMLTARADEDDLLRGLDLGADDYLTKPYSPRELMARVRTLLRRVDRVPRTIDGIRRVGALAVDPVRREVTVDGRPVNCTPGEFAILAAMVEQPERAFTRAQLLEHTRGVDRDSTERAIDTHLVNLRRKIEPDVRRPAYLVTVYGVGYKLRDPAGG